MYIILLGAPGAGKGIQAATLAHRLGLVHVASGDMFRQAVEQGTELGLQVKSYMDQGKLVPDEITVSMVLERLSAPDGESGVVLDGFPRTLPQAKALDQALARQGQTVDKAVYIKVSEEELLRRLSQRWICRQCQAPYHAISSPPRVRGRCDRCGGELYQRPDDQLETVKKRLEVYFAQTAPLINYYMGAGKLIEIDGQGEVAKVGSRLVAALGEESLITR